MKYINKILIIALLAFLPFFSYAYDSPSMYLQGGDQYIPDAQYGKHLCEMPQFKCRKVRPGMTWKGLFHNDKEREMVMRLNRTNVAMRYRPWIVIPKNIDEASYMDLAPFPKHYDTHNHKLLFVDLAVYAFAAYDEHGDLVKWGPASGGKPWCDDTHQNCMTVTGDFHITRMKGSHCKSHTYPINKDGGAPMPYCMFFYKGYAIHGSTLSGFVDRSRGCVRLFDQDAEWLNKHFVKIGTEVIVMR